MANGYSKSDNFMFKMNPGTERLIYPYEITFIQLRKNCPMLEGIILYSLIAMICWVFATSWTVC